MIGNEEVMGYEVKFGRRADIFPRSFVAPQTKAGRKRICEKALETTKLNADEIRAKRDKLQETLNRLNARATVLETELKSA